MSISCFVCEEYYNWDLNPPMTMVPCGHVLCKPCINTWDKLNHTCPVCRDTITDFVINRDYMKLIESKHKEEEKTLKLKVINVSDAKKKKNEIIHDKCFCAVYIIDNSGSMSGCDGKIFIINSNGKVTKKYGKTRWSEACSKIKYIAEYNIKRGICASYHLLNPKSSNNWQENIDYIIIDPHIDNAKTLNKKLSILTTDISSQNNIRGGTPLHSITKYFRENMDKFINFVDNNPDEYKLKPICYNILTDGDPDSKSGFEKELRTLIADHSIFLIINLCTDNDSTINYYNDLDKKLGNELSGFDTIDDYESEEKEILNKKNNFFVYTHNIHICRMAGCYSIICDLMDEQKLNIHYVIKLCNELLCIDHYDNDIPSWNQRKEYIKYMGKILNKNQKVYNYYNKRFTKIININSVDLLIKEGIKQIMGNDNVSINDNDNIATTGNDIDIIPNDNYNVETKAKTKISGKNKIKYESVPIELEDDDNNSNKKKSCCIIL